MKILKMLGLYTAGEVLAKINSAVTHLESLHFSDGETIDRLVRERDGARRDASARATEVSTLKSELAAADNLAAGYRTDAEKWRDYLKRSRDRRVVKTLPPASPKPVAAKAKKGAK